MCSRSKKKQRPPTNGNGSSKAPSSKRGGPSSCEQRLSARCARMDDHEDVYLPHTSSPDTHPDSDVDAEGEVEPDLDLEEEPQEREDEEEEEEDGRPYALRQRQKINYAIPPPLEMSRHPANTRKGRAGVRLVLSSGAGWAWVATPTRTRTTPPTVRRAHHANPVSIDHQLAFVMSWGSPGMPGGWLCSLTKFPPLKSLQ
ncbi:hypothetical protein C8R47DRAFT_1288679 [Mycena vitilis]|nr:hypothetical protein C8R47DRAFT_1288679 [Mycena vitilis]